MTERGENGIVRAVYRNATARYGMNDGRHNQKGEKGNTFFDSETLRLLFTLSPFRHFPFSPIWRQEDLCGL